MQEHTVKGEDPCAGLDAGEEERSGTPWRGDRPTLGDPLLRAYRRQRTAAFAMRCQAIGASDGAECALRPTYRLSDGGPCDVGLLRDLGSLMTRPDTNPLRRRTGRLSLRGVFTNKNSLIRDKPNKRMAN